MWARNGLSRAASAHPAAAPYSDHARAQDAFAGNINLLNAIADAAAALGVAGPISGTGLTGLLDTAIGLIGNVISG